MSLVVCPECGNNVSEYAEACPKCGCPMCVIKSIIRKQNRPPIPEGFCNMKGVLCSKDELQEMYKKDTLCDYLMETCHLSGGEVVYLFGILEMNNGEFPDDYEEAFERYKERNIALRESKAIRCPYCHSTNVEKFLRGGLCPYVRWRCEKCGRQFSV